MQNQRAGIQKDIIVCLILSFVFVIGCVSSPSTDNLSPIITSPNVPTITYTGIPPSITRIPNIPRGATGNSNNTTLLSMNNSFVDYIQVIVHNITILSIKQKSGDELQFGIFDISLKNNGIRRGFPYNNRSFFSFETVRGEFDIVYPSFENYQNESDSFIPGSLAWGDEVRGNVTFQILENVESMVLCVKSPNWIIVGETYIPEIFKFQGVSVDEYPKNLGLVVNSAIRYNTLHNNTLREGVVFAVINVTITNNNPTDVFIKRENLFILTDRDITFEHGGQRVTPEIAQYYLRFPLIIHAGESRTGPILYYVYETTKMNQLLLTDNNFVIHSIVNLNKIYEYE